MTNIPTNLLYTAEHEWLLIEGNTATIGITDHAQAELGDLVFVQLPEVGDQIAQGDDMAVVESVKAASDVYAPVAGTITATNGQLTEEPQRINDSPYDAWLVKIQLDDPAAVAELLTPEEYQALI